MRYSIAAAVLGDLLLSAAAAPPRLAHLDIPTAQSPEILTACIEKKLGLPTKEKPVEGGGVVVEASQPNNFFKRAPMEYWTVAPKDGVNHLTMSYRHPMSEKTAAKVVRMIGRKCFPYELEAAGGGRLPAAGED